MHHNCGFAAIMKPKNDICGQQILLNHVENVILCLCKEAGEYRLQIITEFRRPFPGAIFFWKVRLPSFTTIFRSFRKKTLAKVTKTPNTLGPRF